ncbi:MAG: bifunctional folylpolyglutamate synthase/dihydrofolate synthase [Bacteroidota bacterium]
MNFTTVASIEAYLNDIPKFQSAGASAAKFDLSRFRSFCEQMGNPQKEFASIHVGGSNGKGSTCSLLASVLRQSGYKTGVYSSPHIIDYRERFRINGDYIPDKALVRFFNVHKNNVETFGLTYFEISTAVAFWWFAESEVDIACIEVGLGGRLDATNIINPVASVISSISLDHTDILGDTLEQIAREKAGIIKADTPVVVGDLPEIALETVAQIAKQNDAPLFTIDAVEPRFVRPGHYQLTVKGEKMDIKTNLAAPVQAKNIAISWLVFRAIASRYPVRKRAFVEGLKEVQMGFGRFEKLVEHRQWYFDGGHNLEAVKTLKQSIDTVGDCRRATLVLSMMRDKIRSDVMDEFLEFKNIYYYPLSLERAATFDDINQWLPKAIPFPAADEDRKKLLQRDFDSELVIFSGSFYFYETVRDWVLKFGLM